MIWAIVPAAGSGSRSGSGVPKQYRELLGKPMLHHVLDVLCSHPDINGLMLALAPGDGHWQGIDSWRGRPLRTCIGADTRSGSVLAALQALQDALGNEAQVLVHDAARPCLRSEDLAHLLESAAAHPVGALLAGRMCDTVKFAGDDALVSGTLDRRPLWRAFTPQVFPAHSLRRALEHARQEQVEVSDESAAIERLGLSPLLVEGANDNIKVTVAADFALAEAILQSRSRG